MVFELLLKMDIFGYRLRVFFFQQMHNEKHHTHRLQRLSHFQPGSTLIQMQKRQPGYTISVYFHLAVQHYVSSVGSVVACLPTLIHFLLPLFQGNRLYHERTAPNLVHPAAVDDDLLPAILLQ